MIMKCKITRLLSLFVVMFTMFSMSAFAGDSDYYSKATAKVGVGEGKVYVKYNQPVEENARVYSSESSDESGKDTQSSAPSHSYYLYAQASANYKFVGWYANQNCSGNPLSAENPYIASITANTDVKDATKTYYAKFEYVDPQIPHFEFNQEHIYINIDATPAVPEGLLVKNVVANYVSDNTNVVEIDAEGKLTPKAAGTTKITISAEGYDDIKFLVTVINNVEAGITQIGNGDFEDWSGVTSSNHAPNNWNSFETVELTGLATLGESMVRVQQVKMVEGGRPGSEGLYCVDIYSHYLSTFKTVAQGNLTTGCIHAGGTTATDPENYNYSKISDELYSEKISKVPSAIKLWVKFEPGAINEEHPNAHVAVTVHDAHNYITYSPGNDTKENESYAIAHAVKDFPACDWTELIIPFELTGNTTDGQMYILVNLATNADPGEGQEGDHLYVDDIELLYPETVVYDEYIGITVNNVQNAPVAAPIEVTDNKNGTIDFNLKNFSLSLGGTTANVGNITVPGLSIDNDGNFSFTGNIQITEGDSPSGVTWIGPGLGDIPVDLTGTIKDNYFYVHIGISMAGQDVVVEAGDKADATVSVSEALKGTFCAPFTVAIPSNYQSVVTASTVTGQTNGVLALEPVLNGIIPANTPVVVEALQAFDMNVSGIYVKGTPEVGLLTGVYADTDAPVGSYVLQKNKNGKVGFFKVVEGNKYPEVGANHCYLKDQGSNVKAFYFNEEDATAIENVNVNDNLNEGAEAIYNLAGQRINKLQKGINIINGKKILK